MENVEREDQIKVVVRLRPLMAKETKDVAWRGCENTIESIKSKKYFTFDHVYDPMTRTEDIYNISVKEVVESAMAGYNGTIFAYGQTTSGKTHTIFGSNGNDGIVSMAIETIFSIIASGDTRRYLLRISCIEIYNEKVRDLLSHSLNDLALLEKGDAVYVENLTEEVIINRRKVEKLIHRAFERRVTGETALNEHSSRSHVIVRLIIECGDDITESNSNSYISQLNIVDLAGSESVKRLGTDGDRLKEGAKINCSLLALQKVIQQLSEKSSFVNFRDSKLTRLLKSSLGGNARTLIICTVSSTEESQTLHTLRFAANAKKIVNKPVRNETTEDALLSKYLKTIESLKSELSENRKNETKERDLLEKNSQLAREVERLKKCILTSHINTQVPKESRCARRKTWGGAKAGFFAESGGDFGFFRMNEQRFQSNLDFNFKKPLCETDMEEENCSDSSGSLARSNHDRSTSSTASSSAASSDEKEREQVLAEIQADDSENDELAATFCKETMKEIENLKMETEHLRAEISRMENICDLKDTEEQTYNMRMHKLHLEFEKEKAESMAVVENQKIHNEQLRRENESLKSKLSKLKAAKEREIYEKEELARLRWEAIEKDDKIKRQEIEISSQRERIAVLRKQVRRLTSHHDDACMAKGRFAQCVEGFDNENPDFGTILNDEKQYIPRSKYLVQLRPESDTPHK